MSDPQREQEEAEKRKFAFQKKVDMDWKRKVQREKERLASGFPSEEPAPKPASAPPPPTPAKEAPQDPKGKPGNATDMGFLAVLQQLADQAALFMGLVPGYPERNCEQALATIEMLRALQEKTKGNLSAQETKALTGIVYELQMRYVQACGGGAA